MNDIRSMYEDAKEICKASGLPYRHPAVQALIHSVATLCILREAYAHPCESLDEIKTHVLCQAGVGAAELVRGE